MSNATTLTPHFNTVTAEDLCYLDKVGNVFSIESELAKKSDQAVLPNLFVCKTNPSVSGTVYR